jgi:hypothetical protein
MPPTDPECMYVAAYLYATGEVPPPGPRPCEGGLCPIEVRLSRRIPRLSPFALCARHADRLVRLGAARVRRPLPAA